MKQLLLIALAVFIMQFLFAQNKQQLPEQNSLPADSIILKEVTVTATRIGAAFLSLPYTVAAVSSKEMDALQLRSTPEALAGTAGVFVQKTNHGGGSPFVRGLTGNQTLMLLDGIRLNNATYRFGPNQYLNTIDPWTLSGVEVAGGTGSVQYGSDALGGVIQAFTKEPAFNKEKKWGASLRGKAVTQDMEYSGRAAVSYQSEKLALLAGYSNKKFGDLYGGDTSGRQAPSGYNEQSADVKLRYKPTADVIITLAHQWLRQADVPLYHRVRLENFEYYNFDPQQRQLSYARLEISAKKRLLDKVTFISSYQQTREQRNYRRNGNASKFIEEDKVNTLGLTADVLSQVSKNWSSNSGIEYYHDKVNSIRQQIAIANNQAINQRGLYPNNASNINFSLYTLHHIKLQRFEVETGLRFNTFSIRIPDTVTTALKLGDITVKPSSLVGNLGLLYHITRQQSVYGSFSTGYRAPNIDDLGTLGLVDFRYEVPAYDLKPEQTYNTEFGYKIKSHKIVSSIAIFYMHLTNLITRVQVAGQQVGGYNVYIKQNSQRSFIRGTELSFSYHFSKAFTIKTNAAYQRGQNLSANEPMRRIPPFNGRGLLDYQQKKWSISAEVLFAGKQSRLAKGDQDDNRIPKGGTPGWMIYNLYGSYTIHQFKVFMALQNMMNKDYRTHGSGINGMGRSAALSFQLDL